MPLILQNTGRRALVVELPSNLAPARPQMVRTSRLNPKTGKRDVSERKRVFGHSVTVMPGTEVDKLPNGQPIPDSVARSESVTSKSQMGLRVSKIDQSEWEAKHRPRAKDEAKSRRRSSSGGASGSAE
jgi:hypothetical protein